MRSWEVPRHIHSHSRKRIIKSWEVPQHIALWRKETQSSELARIKLQEVAWNYGTIQMTLDPVGYSEKY
jgi:hypothetical protein